MLNFYNVLLQILKEALKCNDQYSVYQRVATSYSQNEAQNEKAEKIYKIMAKRFCKELEVWVQLGQFYFKTENLQIPAFKINLFFLRVSKYSFKIQ